MDAVASNTGTSTEPKGWLKRLRGYYRRHAFTIKISALIALLLIVAGWQWVVVTVPAGYVAVKYHRFAGGTDMQETYSEGSHLKLPWDKVALYPVRLQQGTRSFDVLTRDRKWFYLASTWRLFEELGKPEATKLAPMAVVFHGRLTRPILGMILLFLGLAVILRDQNRNVFISAGLCLVLCAVFFGATFVARFLGDKEFLSPALAAWLPVFIFGPLSLAQFDAIHT